jgi:large subunit ribosomal protein L9
MKIFLLKDVEKVGVAGEILKVSDGFAVNFLFPRKLAVQVTPENESSFARRLKVVEHRKEVVASKTSMLAERIKSLTITLKRKMHDGDRLYGAVTPGEIVDSLAEKGVSISKNQVVFDKSIKGKGLHTVIIKLSSTLQPALVVKVVEEQQ